MILKALEEFLDVFRPVNDSPMDRLHKAKVHFKNNSFSRKEYMAIHQSISSATASRDLKHRFDQHLLETHGKKL